MSQTYHPVDSVINPDIVSLMAIGTTLTGTLSQLILLKHIKEEKPVEIIDDMIEINEDMIDENHIWPIKYNNETYYVRKKNGAIEIFQLEE